MAPDNNHFIIESSPITCKESDLLQDYDYALVHLAWCIQNNQRYLIFGMVECYPTEITSFCDSEEQTTIIRTDNSNTRLFYIRKQLPIQEALEIYKTGFSENSIQIPWDQDKNGKPKSIVCGEMLANLVWPNLGLAIADSQSDFPFIPRKWCTVRIHQLYPSSVPCHLKELFEYENPIKWLEERLMWNMHEYEDLLGSMHLVLPNPVYRKLNHRLIPGENNSPDQVQLEFCLRNGRTTQGIELYCIEKLSDLYTGAHQIDLQGKLVALLTQNGSTDKIATLVRCRKRGIIDYHPFAGFIKQINANMAVATREKRITVPDTNDSYTVTEYEMLSQLCVGDTENLPIMELGKKLAQKKSSRQQAKLASEFGQKIFYGKPDDARQYIRKLVQKAKREVIIVDPYFSTVELFNFAYACESKINLQIITSAKALKAGSDLEVLYQQERAEPPSNKGLELYSQIHTNLASSNIQILVMKGEKPAIHDRFLIVDDEVWLSGNSLNNLGKRLSALIKLPDPQPLLTEIDCIRKSDRVELLEEWVSNHNAKTAK